MGKGLPTTAEKPCCSCDSTCTVAHMYLQASDTAEPAPAVKKMTLKRVPRVLVLHLSRFSHDQSGASTPAAR